MKHGIKFSYAIIFVYLLCASPALSQEVLVDMPQSQGYVDVPMQMVVVFKDVTSKKEPSIPEIDGFTVRKRPGAEQSSQTTFTNGKITSSTTSKFVFFLTPIRLGEAQIPALTFIADDKAFQTIPMTITVIDTPTSGALTVEITGTDKDVYLGQPIDLTLRILVEQFTDPILEVTIDERDMFSFLSNNSTFGIFTSELQDGKAKVQTIHGKTKEGVPAIFYEYTVHATTWPVTTGDLELEQVLIVANYPISLTRQRRNGIFGGNSLVVNQSKRISALAVMPSITVLNPPEAGRPDWYTGAVGTFDFRVVADPTSVNVGEPITITMRITDLSSGHINLDYLPSPALDRVPALTSQFKVPDKPLGGITQGRTKTFTQTIRPRNDEASEIPSLPMASFDPITNSYKTVWTNAIPIQVHAVATVSASNLVGGSKQNSHHPIQQLTEVDGGILANYIGEPLLSSQKIELTTTALAGIVFPPLACFAIVLTLFYNRRSRTEESKKKYAKKNALKTIHTLSQANNKEDIQLLAKSLRTISSDKSDLQEVQSLLKRCDAVQFGGENDVTLSQDVKKLVEAIS